MNTQENDDVLGRAIDALQTRSDEIDLSDLQRGVWAEVERTRAEQGLTPRLLAFFLQPLPSALACCAAAVAIGIGTALVRANSYEEGLTTAMEQRYVSQIHPLYMTQPER